MSLTGRHLRNPVLVTVPYLTVGGQVFVGGKTIAQLQALGTSTDPAVSATAPRTVAYDTTNERWVYCQTAAASSSTWAYRWVEHMRTLGALTTKQYWNWCDTGQLADLTTPASQNLRLAAGALLSVKQYTVSSPGSTIVGLHINENATALETVTVTPSGGGVVTTYAFTAAAVYSAGNRISISQDPTSAPGLQYATVEGWELSV